MPVGRNNLSHIPFTVDAALLRELGERLIGRAHIALGELVKNAYDADAHACRVDMANDRIVVADDGHGISQAEFENYWSESGRPTRPWRDARAVWAER